ncbi:hypothetical protein PVC01_000132700 [Plasmodium vivax]|uniref:Uncharacterized protein n=1 Tax=Plasmodium vivax TaxID=5855 RepID=A0A1G4EF73_PLAVI|nr:hypothetical protein PVC01_000132700 [Plasmodium vivax]
MGMLENYNIGKNVNFTIFLKKFTFFFLILSHLTYNDMVFIHKHSFVIFIVGL